MRRGAVGRTADGQDNPGARPDRGRADHRQPAGAQAASALSQLAASRKRRAALSLCCFGAIPDGKPLHTFPGIALRSSACAISSKTSKPESCSPIPIRCAVPKFR
ncbi:hypothetical protein FJW06_28900 [Mesorhizobium sp. B4-1-3]|nr:hypothetical protein FJW06_28900 [Mesorhizobium sp. B4-1-3]